MRLLAIVFVTTMLLSSCSTATISEEPPEEQTPVLEISTPVLEISAKEVEAAWIQFAFEKRDFWTQGADFSLRFFKQASISFPDNNLFLSPYSLACALGMLYNGAEGETKEEIATLLGMSNYNSDQINEYFQTLTKGLLAVDPQVDFGVANAFWSHSPYPAKKNFADLIKTYYDAEVSTIDFSLPSSLDAINDWCNEKTKGTIPRILGELNPPMVLANAVYFKSPWTVPFEKSETVVKSFYNQNGTTSSVPMMHQKELLLRYSHTTDVEFLRLPYANEAFAMNILLPKEGVDIDEVIASIDGATWRTLTRSMQNVYVTLSMPRFTLADNTYFLSNVLKDMGMTHAFSKDASFLAMLDVNSPIGEVIHKSYIEVNEEGTEASAVTVIVPVGSIGYPLPPPPHVIMEVNRPFIFAISEQYTEAIIFMGKISNL